MSSGATNATGGPRVLSADQVAAVNGVSNALQALSIVGSTFILLCYCLFPRLRRFTFTLVAMLSFTDILSNVADLVEPSPDSISEMSATGSVTAVCYAQAIGQAVFELAAVLWTSSIAFTLYANVIWHTQFVDNAYTLLKFGALCYGLPAVLALAAGVDGAFGPSGPWCWITDGKSYWRFVVLYAPLWLCVLLNTVAYARVLIVLRRLAARAGTSDTAAQRIKLAVGRVQLYPLILVVVWVFPTINRLYELVTSGDQVFALFLLQRTFSSLQGLLNAVAYGLSASVREALNDAIAPHCRCCGLKDTAGSALVGPRLHFERTAAHQQDAAVVSHGGGAVGPAGIPADALMIAREHSVRARNNSVVEFANPVAQHGAAATPPPLTPPPGAGAPATMTQYGATSSGGRVGAAADAAAPGSSRRRGIVQWIMSGSRASLMHILPARRDGCGGGTAASHALPESHSATHGGAHASSAAVAAGRGAPSLPPMPPPHQPQQYTQGQSHSFAHAPSGPNLMCLSGMAGVDSDGDESDGDDDLDVVVPVSFQSPPQVFGRTHACSFPHAVGDPTALPPLVPVVSGAGSNARASDDNELGQGTLRHELAAGTSGPSANALLSEMHRLSGNLSTGFHVK